MSGSTDAAPARRAWTSALQQVGTPVVSTVLAIGVCSLIIWMSGYDPIEAFSALFKGAFGGPRQIGETVLRSTPLILAGLAVGYGFRAGLFNIGAEGQLMMGGLMAAWLGVQLAGLPALVSVPTLIVAAVLAGAAWAFIPAILKARIGAHEVITTMMFSHIARYIVAWLTAGPIKAPGQIPQSVTLPETSTIPKIVSLFPEGVVDALPMLGLGRAHVGILIAVLVAVGVWLVLRYTTLGYENRAVGLSPWAAETAGISVQWTTVKALCISGALAGLAGAVEVMGLHHRVFDQFSAGVGFTGIAVALLAKNHPIGIIAAALLFGALSAGSGTMQLEAGVSQKIILIIQALVIFFVAAEGIVNWLVRKRQKGVTSGA